MARGKAAANRLAPDPCRVAADAAVGWWQMDLAAAGQLPPW